MSIRSNVLLLPLLIVLNALIADVANGIVTKIQTRNLPDRNDIQLYCIDDGGVEPILTMNLGLRRFTLVNGQLITETFTDFTVFGPGITSLIITPDIEGNFTCVDLDTNTVATNSIPIVGEF